MKKMLAMVAMVALGTAGAQTWETEIGKLQLTGCYGKQDGVYCDFNYTLTKQQTASVRWTVRDFKVFKQDGVSQQADGVAFIDGKFGSYDSSTKEIIANVPVKVQAYFNIPASTAAFRALEINERRMENIPIRALGAAQPATPTPLPAASGVKGFNISLSNCQLQGQNYVCTATLTPTR